MATPQPYKLMIKTLAKSRAKFLKLIPMKSFVEGEKFEISFRLENIAEKDCPKGKLRFRIEWPNQQVIRLGIPIRRGLRRNEPYEADKALVEVLSDGYGLVYIETYEIPQAIAKDLEGIPRFVEFYSGKRVEDHIDVADSISAVKSKSWQEIYGFWALIVATIGLAIIALDTVSRFAVSLLEALT